MTRSRDTANTQENTGGALPPFVAGKNFLINGNFDIWQRGTSFTTPASTAYTADRWNNGGSAGGTYTVSQQTTGVPVGSQYCLRNAYNSSGSFCNKNQIIETANTIPLQGQTVTFSIKLRKNASLTTNIYIGIDKSATVDASLSSTWVGLVSVTVTNASLPTGTTSSDWYTAKATATVPSDGTANSLRVYVAEVSTQGSGAYFEMAQAQLEIGSVATPFARVGGTIQGELAACQRYYFRNTPGTTFGNVSSGLASSTTDAITIATFPVTMRTAPTLLEWGNLRVTDMITFGAAPSSITLTGSESSPNTGRVVAVTTGLTTYRPYYLSANNNTAGYIAFGAEL